MQLGSTFKAWAALTVSLALAPVAVAQVVPVFIFAGQSNAVGFATDYSELTLAQQLPQSNVLYAGQHQNPVSWGTISGPTQVNTPNAPDPFDPVQFQVYSGQGIGPEFSAPLTISNALGGSTVGAVKYALNIYGLRQDSGQDDWSPASGELYPSVVSRVNTATSQLPIQQPGKTAQVSGFFWMQGERDAQDEDRADLYQGNLVDFISNVRTQFGANLPIVIGRVMNDDGHGAQIDTIRRAQENVARLIPNVAFVNTDDLQRGSPSIPVGTLHYSTQGTYDLGVRMGQAYMSLQNPLPTGPASMNLAANGSFEDYAIGKFAGFPGTYPFGGTQAYPSNPMPGWTAGTATGYTLVRQDAFGGGTAPASQGQQFLSLENGLYGTGNGGAKQTISTTSGQLYHVFFDYSAIARGDNATVSFSYDTGGAATSLLVSTNGLGDLDMPAWQQQMFSFNASSSSTTLRFLPTATGDDGTFYGPTIDNVKIVAGPVWVDNAGGNNDFNNNGRWSGGAPASGAGAIVNFMGVGTNFTPTLNANRTFGSLRFDSATSYNLASGGFVATMDVTSGNATVLVAQGSHTIAAALTLADSLDVDTAQSSTLTLSGQITPGGVGRALRKFGAGSLVLSNSNNTYDGATSVVAGTLRLANGATTNSIAASPSVSVYRGATLDVSGLSGGGITLASGQDLLGGGIIRGGVNATTSGHLISPGASPGIMTFAGTGNITLDIDATLDMEVGGTGSATGTAGVNYDQIVIDGSGKSLSIGGARLNLVALPGRVMNQPYTLVSAVNGATINFSTLLRGQTGSAFLTENVEHFQGSMGFSVNYESTFVTVTFMTPEPSSLGTLILAAMALVRRRR